MCAGMVSLETANGVQVSATLSCVESPVCIGLYTN